MSATPSGVRWIVLTLLCLTSFVGYVLRINMSIVGEAMIRDLRLSTVQFGVVLSGFAWAYGLCQVPGGLWGSKIGARRSMTWVLLAWGVLTCLTGLVPGPSIAPAWAALTALVAIRLAMGVTQAPLYPITGGISIADWFPVRVWGIVNGLLTASLSVGAAGAAPLSAWLADTLGWRQAFIAMAPIGFISAAVWWALYRDDPAAHPGVNGAELDLIRGDLVRPRAATARRTWRGALWQRDTLALTFSYFCTNYAYYLFFNWFYFYLVDVRGMPRQVGGYYTGGQWIVGAIAAGAGGWFCDRISNRYGSVVGCRATVVGGLLLCAPLLLAGALAASPLWAVALLSLSFAAIQATDAAYWYAAIRIGGPHASATTGLMNTGGNIVGGIGAVLVPLIARELGWVAALSTGAWLALAAAAAWIWVRAETSAAGATSTAEAGVS